VGSVSLLGFSSADEFTSNAALLASLIADLAAAAGVNGEQLTITSATIVPDSNPPVLDVTFAVAFADGATAEVGTAGLADNESHGLDASFLRYLAGLGITISDSDMGESMDVLITSSPTPNPTGAGPTAVETSLLFTGTTLDEFDSDQALLDALIADLANSAGVEEEDVIVAATYLVEHGSSSPTVVVEFTVIFADAEAAIAGRAALMSPTLTNFEALVDGRGDDITYAIGDVSEGVALVSSDTPTHFPSAPPSAPPIDSPTGTGPIAVEISLLFTGTTLDEFDSDQALLDALIADLANSAGVEEEDVIVAATYLVEHGSSSPTVVGEFTVIFADAEAATAGRAALMSPTLTNFEALVDGRGNDITHAIGDVSEGIAILPTRSPTSSGSNAQINTGT
jgi:hypothetical protein